MNIRKVLARLINMSARLERGQALAEYWPTFAGAMAVTTIVLVQVGGGVKDSYCTIVDAVGDRPEVCEVETPGDPEEPVGDTDPSEEPSDGTCVISISDAETTNPGDWSGQWDGGNDVLQVNVEQLDEPLSWSLVRSFPSDPSSEATEISSGAITEDGTFEIAVEYPAEGNWGPVSMDGSGKYEAQTTLQITEPCGTVSWNRWYNAELAADLGVSITHETSPVTKCGDTLTYIVTVTNNGPHDVEITDGEGALVNLPVPPDVNVVSTSASQGTCDTQIACDLGEMAVGSTATITVETTVPNVDACNLDGTSTVSAAYPPDPDMSNNTATTNPFCEQASMVCVDTYQFGIATDFNAFSLGDFSSQWSDTEGRVAAAGDVSLQGYTVGLQLDSGVWSDQDVLIAGNNLTYNGGDVHGNATYGGSANVSGTSSIHGDLLSGAPINFNNASAQLKALSTLFANTETTGTTTKQNSSLKLDGDDPQMNVFEVSASQLSSVSEILITVPSGSTALVNVSGSSITSWPGGFAINGNHDPSASEVSRIVFNLYEATTVKIGGGLFGSMLAPNADVNFTYGVIWGTLVTGSFDGSGQINYVPFEGCVPPLTY